MYVQDQHIIHDKQVSIPSYLPSSPLPSKSDYSAAPLPGVIRRTGKHVDWSRPIWPIGLFARRLVFGTFGRRIRPRTLGTGPIQVTTSDGTTEIDLGGSMVITGGEAQAGLRSAPQDPCSAGRHPEMDRALGGRADWILGYNAGTNPTILAG